MVIEPTVGRVVWYRPSRDDEQTMFIVDGQPLDAHVVYVHGTRMVNLVVFDHNGGIFQRSSVTLFQEGDDEESVKPHGRYCEWMGYQLDQAKKHANA